MKILFISFVIISGLLTDVIFAEDRKSEENRRKIEKINAEIKEKISRQYKLYEEEKNLLFQIQRFDQKLDNKKKALKLYNNKLAEIEVNIGSLRNQIGYSSSEMAKLEDSLKIRVLQVYREGKYKNLKLLMSAVSLKDFIKKYNYLIMLAKKDIDLRNKYSNQKNSYNIARRNLEAKYENYEKHKKEAAGKEREIEAEKEQKKKLLKNILTEKVLYTQAINELKTQSSKLEELVNEIEKKAKNELKVDISDMTGDIFRNKGKLPYPVKGELVSGFGKYKHPKFNAYVNNNGIEIGVNPDQEVRAVFGGVVLFADWFKGYGKTILIDCGNNVIIVYGHFSEILVNAGQKVLTEQAIGKTGESGASDRPTLYFEIRSRGKPENPLNWLKK
ncbi:MAG: peptidoglycan DD-metalloendopeptidase family protein [Candidatus Firestonebacteria bacterium]